MFERKPKRDALQWINRLCTLDTPAYQESPQTVSGALENSPPGDLGWIKTQANFNFYFDNFSVNTKNKIAQQKKVNDFSYLQIFSSKGSTMFLCSAVKVQNETLDSFVVITVRWDAVD